MNLNDIFDHEVRQLGGRFRVEDVPENVRAFYDDISARANDLIKCVRDVIPKLPPVHFDYVLNGKINALAFRRGDTYFIGLHTGALFMLRLVIGRMLSDASLFPSIGNPTAEESSLPPLSGYSVDADDMYTENPIRTPNDALRRYYAAVIQDQAIMFLVGHELAHITRGHVDYLMNQYQQPFTSELGWYGFRAEQSVIERQSIEADADQRSVGSRIDSLRVTCEDPANPVPPWTTSLGDRDQRILDWATSLHILFRLFGDVRFTQEDLTTSPYPPLALRRIMAELVTMSWIGRIWDPSMIETASHALRQAQNDVDHAFATILGEDISIEGLRDAVAHRKHALRLVHYWNLVMRKKCKPFAYEY